MLVERDSSTAPIVDEHDAAGESLAGITFLHQDIFTIAYDPATPPTYSRAEARSSLRPSLVAIKLLIEIFCIAPLLLLSYFFCAFWESVEPALDIYLSALLLGLIERGLLSGDMSRSHLYIVIGGYILSSLFSAAIRNFQSDVDAKLRGHLRAHYWPRLAQTSLNLDFQSSQEFSTVALLPREGLFDWDVPGADFLVMISQKFRVISTISLQIIVLSWVISQKSSPEREILIGLGVAHPIILFFSPFDESNTAAHIVWTESKPFMKMKALYTLVFADRFRQDLTTDGATSCVYKEYETVSRAAGPVPDIKRNMMRGIPRVWYWKFLDDFILQFSLVAYAFTLPWTLSMSSLATIALLHHVVLPLRFPFSRYVFRSQPSFAQICQLAKDFYDALDLKSKMSSGTNPFPGTISSEEGVKISCRNITYRYSDTAPDALNDISLDILPGQLVVVVGVNGSGKSTLVKMIARLFDPTHGDILLDDLPLRSYDIEQVRPSMAFLSQNSEIYPLSIRDNFTVGLPLGQKEVTDADIDKAARLGGAYDLIQRFPNKSDTVLDPVSPFVDTMNGWVGGASPNLAALRQRKNAYKSPISTGEKQRILASRMFMRLNHINARLVVVDEPTSALDSVAESEVFARLIARRKGKTMIFVTHRFGNIVKHADLILCMKEGTIVEQGTHDALMNRQDGEYAKMYSIQAGGYEKMV